MLTSELNERVSAEAFIRDEIQLVRRELSKLPAPFVANTGTSQTTNTSGALAAINSTQKDLALRKKKAVKVQKSLAALAVSGTTDPTGSVSGLVGGYMDFVLLQADEDTTAAAARVLAQSEFDFIEQMVPILDAFAGVGITDLASAELQLRILSNDIPAIQNIQFPTQSIVRNFDFSIIETVSNNQLSETNYKDRFEAFKAQSKSVRSQLEDRRRELVDEEILQATQNSRNPAEKPSSIPQAFSLTDRLGFTNSVFVGAKAVFAQRSTTSLTILLGLFSGCLGALFLGLVSHDGSAFVYLMKGAVAGLVAIFVIKGGNTLLTVNITDVMDVANPFSVALVGFIFGLFTDRFFEYAKSLVENVTPPQSASEETDEYLNSQDRDSAISNRIMEAIPEDAKSHEAKS